MDHLHIDVETYSSVDLKTAGMYKYCEALDFEILLVSYSFNGQSVKTIDLTRQAFPLFLRELIARPDVLNIAHNAAFERTVFTSIGIETDPSQWYCTAVKAAYHGLPLSLGDVSKALDLGADGKDVNGKRLIDYFCKPCKPTKANGMRERNLPEHDPQKWQAFVLYNAQDVVSEMRIYNELKHTEIPPFERTLYALDQKINGKGVHIDLDLARNAVECDLDIKQVNIAEAKYLTGLSNPASVPQLKGWLEAKLQKPIKTLAKETLKDLAAQADSEDVKRVIELRLALSKTSIKKYDAMLACACQDGHARGLFQFYGAMRTGRWAGRIVQLQNLKRNKTDYLDEARQLLLERNFEAMDLLYDDVPDILSQLIRTALVPSQGKTFAVIDFSAIEARVLAWLAGERWRLEVFETHGKIYEASASAMFGVPLESITKGSPYRDKGKVSELALGYQGGVGALKAMGADDMGLSETEMQDIVTRWRAASPAIVEFWGTIQSAAQRCVRHRAEVTIKNAGIKFDYAHGAMRIKLPSGRLLMYHGAEVYAGRFGDAVRYKGVNQDTKQWGWVETYGGKLAENITQAVARDVLAYKMVALDENNFDIRMHIHDEVVVETDQLDALERMSEILSERLDWAKGLPLAADGYFTDYYKKD